MSTEKKSRPMPVVNKLKKSSDRKITVSVSEGAFKNIKKQLEYLQKSNSVLASTVKTAEDFVVFHIEHLTSMTKGSGIISSGAFVEKKEQEVLWKVPSLSDEKDLLFETFKETSSYEEIVPVSKKQVEFSYGVDKEKVFDKLQGLSVEIHEDGEVEIEDPNPEHDIMRTFNDEDGLESFERSVFGNCYVRVNSTEDSPKTETTIVCPKNASSKYKKDEVIARLLKAVDDWDVTPEDVKNSNGAIELTDEVRDIEKDEDEE